MRWLVNHKNFLLTIVESGVRIVIPVDWVLVRSLFGVADSWLLVVPHLVGRERSG